LEIVCDCDTGLYRVRERVGLPNILCPMHADGSSAVEHRPADIVSQSLIVWDKVANGLRQLLALPLPLKQTGILFLAIRCGRTHRLDRLGRSRC